MSKSSKGEGIKIAQAAKDLNVTSVTIRRYISEFNIETTEDENGIKVLPPEAMDELQEVRRLKEDGLTNAQVLESLEESRSKPAKKSAKKEPAKKTAKRVTEVKKETRKPTRSRVAKDEDEDEEEADEAPAAASDDEDEEEEQEAPKRAVPPKRGARRITPKEPVAEEEEQVEEPEAESESEAVAADVPADGRSKHTLTCQTCQKTFEHLNPRLRDCLECYRAKRKERRRGGDKNRNVIAHPLAQQVANKQQQRSTMGGDESAHIETFDVTPTVATHAPVAQHAQQQQQPLRMSSQRIDPLRGMKNAPVRNYRKAIEETRQITTNLKRRLERPDLPENERRWLEQIYAYQLILHQGWRHLAEYKAGNPPTRDRGEGGNETRERGERGGEHDHEGTDRFERGERGGERAERGGERGERGAERGERGGERGERGGRYDRGDRGGRDRYRGGGRDRDRNRGERSGERPDRSTERGDEQRETVETE